MNLMSSFKRVFEAIKWGVLREFWEYRRLFVVLPVSLSVLALLSALYITINVDPTSGFSLEMTFGADENEKEKIATLSLSQGTTEPVSPELERRFEEYQFVDEEKDVRDYDHGQLAENAGDLLPTAFLGLGFFIAAYYLLSALYDDRKNHSILFWKSLPISEYQTVGIKLAVGLVLVPLVFVTVSWVSLLSIKLLFSFVGQWVNPNAGMVFWAKSIDIGGSIARSVLFWLIAVVWSLPMASLCLFVSAAAKRTPVVSLGVAMLCVLFVEHLIINKTYLVGWFTKHNPFYFMSDASPVFWILQASHELLLESLLTVVVSTGLYFATVWCRRHRFELA